MTTDRYLRQLWELDAKIQNRLDDLQYYRSLMYGIRAISNDDKVQTSGNFDRIGNQVAKLIELEDKLEICVKTYIEKRQSIVQQIESLDDVPKRQVLYNRYIKHLAFPNIARQLGYSERQVFRIYKSALSEFENKFGETYKGK